MASVNMLRGILVGLAAVAAVVAAVFGEWLAVAVLGVGLVAHGLMWLYLYRLRASHEPARDR